MGNGTQCRSQKGCLAQLSVSVSVENSNRKDGSGPKHHSTLWVLKKPNFTHKNGESEVKIG